MKKRILQLTLAVMLLISMTACENEDSIKITLSESAVTVTQYDEYTLTASVVNSSQKVKWGVDSGNIELVADGNSVTIAGITPGEYNVTATIDKVVSACRVKITSLPQDPYAVDVEVKHLGKADGSGLSYNASVLLGGASVSSVGVYDISGILVCDISDKYDSAAKQLTLSEAELEDIGLGEHTIKFACGQEYKSFALTIATLLIDTYDKFTSKETGMPSFWTNERINTDPLKDGYFILRRDIDFKDKPAFAMNTNGDGISGMPAGPNEYENSWFGTFDGRGHAAKNITVDRYGIFAHIGIGAVVKNFGVINGSISVPSGNMGWLFSFGMDGLIDNCYAELTEFPNVSETAIFCRQLRRGGKITNSIAAVKIQDASGYAAAHAAVTHHSGGDNAYISNMYLLRRGEQNKAVGNFTSDKQGVWGAFEFSSDLINAVKRRYYEQFEGTSPQSASFDGFNTEYWSIDNGGSGQIYFGSHIVFDAEK